MIKTLKTETISLLMLLVGIIMLSMSSCSKDSDIPNPTPDKDLIINSGDSLYEALNDGSVVVDITSNKQFSYSINGGDDWITPVQDAHVYDKGDHIQIEFTLQTLALNSDKRTAQIVFTTTDKSQTKTVLVFQSGMIDVKMPGTLEQEINKAGIQDPLTILKLSLKGKLNSADIICLRNMTGGGIQYGHPTDGHLSDLDISMVSFQVDPSIYYTDAENSNFSIYDTDILPWLMFSNCNKLSMIKLPATGIRMIGAAAFQYCPSLINVIIPNSVTTIAGSAFLDCSSLVNITIPNNVTSMRDAVFQGCSSLKSVNIPNGVTFIQKKAFYGCISLFHITIPEGVTIIDNMAFQESGLTSLIIPASVTTIGDSAFYKCSQLQNFTMKIVHPQCIVTGACSFSNLPQNAFLYVPKDELVTYKNMQIFTRCFNKENIVPIE